MFVSSCFDKVKIRIIGATRFRCMSSSNNPDDVCLIFSNFGAQKIYCSFNPKIISGLIRNDHWAFHYNFGVNEIGILCDPPLGQFLISDLINSKSIF
jgi:hypothetical protein